MEQKGPLDRMVGMRGLDWGRLVETHADRAYVFALGLSGNEEDAKELVQEAFARAMARERQLDGRPFESWFLTVLKNIYVDSLRRFERRHGLPLDAAVGPEGLSVADAVADRRDPPLLARLERAETKALVRRAIRGLSPSLKGVLLMIDLQGMGYDETARALGCPLNTIRSRVVRARAALKARILALEALA